MVQHISRLPLFENGNDIRGRQRCDGAKQVPGYAARGWVRLGWCGDNLFRVLLAQISLYKTETDRLDGAAAFAVP